MKAANPVDRMDVQINRGMGLGLSRGAATKLARLRTPERIQDFISAIPINFEPEGDTTLSVAEVLKQNRAHCFEGALVAACALYQSGQPPLLMDMSACEDDDHVLAIFRRGGCWGAISKGNSVWLRFRDPIYRRSAADGQCTLGNSCWFLSGGHRSPHVCQALFAHFDVAGATAALSG